MALDADEVVIGANGAVYVGAVGSTGPTDIETALDAAFTHLGYVTDDGITLTPGMDTAEINAWQSFYPVRRIVTSRSFDIAIPLLQWNQESIKLAFGGGSFATTAGPPAYYTYTPPSPEEIDYRALVLEWADDTKEYRLHVPKVLVTDAGDLSLNRTDAAALDLTFSLEATDGSNPFTLITNDPAFA